MHLECFKCHDTPPKIVPGRPERSWMSSFHSRAPYRCLPLTMANSTGWEILCPTDIEVSWNGGLAKQDLLVKNVANDSISIEHFAQSHFSRHPHLSHWISFPNTSQFCTMGKRCT